MNLRSTLAVPVMLAALSITARPQRPRPLTPASVAGTYALGTRELPTPSADGCWLATAPIGADSLHVGVRCTKPPGHHIGVFDARVAFGRGTAVYATNRSGGPCRITMRFAASQVVVTQDGSDQLCGFGAFVTVSGTYERLITIIDPKDTAAYAEAGREAVAAVARCHAPACRPDIFRGPGRGELTVGLDSSRGVRRAEYHEFQWHNLPDTEPPPGGQAFQDSAWVTMLTRMEREKPQRLLLIDGVPRS